MDLFKARTDVDAAITSLAAVRVSLLADPTIVVVRAGENLQAALDRGGRVELEPGAAFVGSFTLRSDAILSGNAGSVIRGTTGPALLVPPGTSRVTVQGVELRSSHNEVLRVGENMPTQSTIDRAPVDVTVSNVRVPSHRGQRGFSIHGRDVKILNCEVLDCWDPKGLDSQAVYVGNTNGPITIRGGRFSAGSEIILFGGDSTRIPNVIPTNVLVEGVELFRPLSWLTDGNARKVKNILEVKNGDGVTVRQSILRGCWANGQQGEAFVLTPDLDGDRQDPPLQSGTVRNILVEDVTVTDCSTLVGLLGRAYRSFTPDPLSGVVFRRVTATLNRAKFGGRGQLVTMGGEPNDVTFEDCTIVQDGTSLVYYDPGGVIDPVSRVYRAAGRIARLAVRGTTSTMPEYGFNLSGFTNGRSWPLSVNGLEITGNTFTGSTAMKTAFPANVYR